MAIVFVQSAKGRNPNIAASASTAAINTAAGNALIIGISWYLSGRTLTGVTDNDGGTAPHLDQSAANAGGQSGVYSKFNITAKIGYQATVTLDGIGYCSIAVAEVSGIGAGSVTGIDRLATGTTTATTTTLRASHELAFGVCADVESTDRLSMSAGWAVDQNTEAGDTNANVMIGHQIVSATTALTLTSGANNLPTVIIATYQAAFVCITGLVNNHASIGANLVQRDNTQTWSVRFSIKFDGNVSNQPSVVFSNVLNDGVYAGYEVYIQEGASRVRARIIHDIANNYIGRTGGTSINDSIWKVVYVTYDGSSTAAGVKIYLDGVRDDAVTESDTLTLSSNTAGQQMFIASQNGRDATFYLNGAIRGLMVWSDVKDQTFVTNNSTLDNLPGADGNTLLRLAFSEGTGLTAADTGGAGDTATLTSASMWNGTAPVIAPLSILSGGGDIGTIRNPLVVSNLPVNILSRDRGIRWRGR